jgi:hypothetical protein
MRQPIFQTACGESIPSEDGRLVRTLSDTQVLRRVVLKAPEQVVL